MTKCMGDGRCGGGCQTVAVAMVDGSDNLCRMAGVQSAVRRKRWRVLGSSGGGVRQQWQRVLSSSGKGC